MARYIELIGGRPGAELGQFHAAGDPDRIVALRGFSSSEARRRTLTQYHASEAWAGRRAELADITRSEEVILARAIAPAEGTRPMRPGESYQLLVSELRFAEQVGDYHLWLRLLLRKAGLDPVAAFATLEAVNDVPAVPVIKNRTHHIALMRMGRRPPELPPELRNMVRFSPETLVLEPAWMLVS